jgi:hypothetical protein
MNQITKEHPLYFRRDKLAEGCFALLEEHGGRWLLISSPLNTGKTTFLRNEFTLAAEKRGRHVLYYSFGRNAASSRVDSFTGWLANKAGVPNEGPVENVLMSAVAALARHSFRPVLVLDEFPQVAANRLSAPFIASLRSALDTHRGLPVVFTASRPALEHAVFRDNGAPFFNFATTIPFDLPKPEFLSFLHGVLARFRPEEFTPEALSSVFSIFGGRVGDITDFLQSVLLVQPLSLVMEARLRSGKIGDDFTQIWDTLTEAQRATLADLAGDAGAYPPGVSIGARTSALRTLCKKAVLFHSGRGEYDFTDSRFLRWIKENWPRAGG